MKTATIQINCKVKFAYDDTRNSLEDAIGNAIDLFLNPNYHTVLCNTKLIDHEILDKEVL